jgi:hypothetical protein
LNLKYIFEWVGYILTGLWFLTLLWGISLQMRRILPVLLRLGKGLALRKIAIFADDKMQSELKGLLLESGIFYKRNVISICSLADLELSQRASIFLVHWPSWGSNIDQILQNKKEGTGIVVYAPHDGGSIPNDILIDINNRRSASVVNFRGRLINDIFVLMMTTKFSD